MAGRIRWEPIAEALRADPGRWIEVAQNVSVGSADYVRKRYGIDLRLEGIDPATHVAERAFGRWTEPGTESTPARERYRPDGERGVIDHHLQLRAVFTTERSRNRAVQLLHQGRIDPNRLRWRAC